MARKRCWRYDWVVDLDIRGFFDHIDHALLLRAVRKHTSCKWVLLYIERWLRAPIQQECQRRSKSTPLAGVKMHHLMRFSPALAVVPVVHRRDPRCFV